MGETEEQERDQNESERKREKELERAYCSLFSLIIHLQDVYHDVIFYTSITTNKIAFITFALGLKTVI